MADCEGVRTSTLSGMYQAGEDLVLIEWRRWCIDQLEWSHAAMMLFLQGAPLQNLLLPYQLLAGFPRPVMSVPPGMDRVVLAEIFIAPPEITQQQLFELLVPSAQGA